MVLLPCFYCVFIVLLFCFHGAFTVLKGQRAINVSFSFSGFGNKRRKIKKESVAGNVPEKAESRNLYSKYVRLNKVAFPSWSWTEHSLYYYKYNIHFLSRYIFILFLCRVYWIFGVLPVFQDCFQRSTRSGKTIDRAFASSGPLLRLDEGEFYPLTVKLSCCFQLQREKPLETKSFSASDQRRAPEDEFSLFCWS